MTTWTLACQAPLTMAFSRQEYYSGYSFPSPGIKPDLGVEPMSLISPQLAGRFFTTEPPGRPSDVYLLKSLKQSQIYIILESA